MSNSDQHSFSAPYGVEPEVLTRLHALLERPSVRSRRPSHVRQTAHTNPDLDGLRSQNVAGKEDFETPERLSLLTAAAKEGTDGLIPKPGQWAPKVIARCIYPSQRQLASEPAPLPPISAPSQPTVTPNLSTLLSTASKYLLSFFIDDEPGVIEYSTAQIALKLKIRVEVQAVEFTCQSNPSGSESASSALGPSQPFKKEVGIVAFLRVEDGNSLGPTRKIPIVARPKRVRELLKKHGVYAPTEEIYGDEIKGALRGLRRKLDAVEKV